MDEATRTFWQEYADQAGVVEEPTDVFAFGDSPQMAAELGRLVLTGTKRATAALAADCDPPPAVGDHAVLHLGDGVPAAVLRTTGFRVGPLSSADEDFAYDEGEGDRTLLWWMQAHVAFFRRRCAELGLAFHPDIEVGFERFEVLWPPAYADRSSAGRT